MSTAGGVTVEPVTTSAGFDAFVDFGTQVHGHGRYVPTLTPTVASWYAGEHAQARFGPVTFLLARDVDGEVVGRACTHHDPRFDDKVNAAVQLFGLTEFFDAPALAALTAEVEHRAKRSGRTAIVGPVSLLPNQTGGVITSGFGERGFVDSPWTPDHYPAAYESMGFERIFEGATWICDEIGDLDPDVVHPFDDARMDAEGLSLHTASPWEWRMRVLPIFADLLNASFASLPYYTHIETDEMREQCDGMEFIMDRRLVVWLERHGVPISFALAVPDVSEFVMKRQGRFGMREQLTFLTSRHRYRREAILIVKGTVPTAQGRGYQNLLSRQVLRGLREGGYTALRSTFVGDDNLGSAAQYRHMGGRRLHGTTFYRREVR